MSQDRQAVPLSALQRVLRASVLRHIPVPMEVLERHLTAEEMEAVRSLVDEVPTNRRDIE